MPLQNKGTTCRPPPTARRGERLPLSPREREAYDAIVILSLRDGMAPTRAEIAKRMRCCEAAATRHVVGLRRKGWITVRRRVPRGIELRG